MRSVLVGLLVLAACSLLTVSAASAQAGTPGPGFRITSIPGPTNFSSHDNRCSNEELHLLTGASCDAYILLITNSGSRPTDGSPITITDFLPAGLKAQSIRPEFKGDSVPGIGFKCSTLSTRCVYTGVVGTDQVVEVMIYVTVTATGPKQITNSVEVTGGGASEPALANFHNAISDAPPTPGLQEFRFEVDGPEGGVDAQAGDHPYEATASFNFASELPRELNSESEAPPRQQPNTEIYAPVETVKDVYVNLPPGFVGNTQNEVLCNQSVVEGHGSSAGDNHCPPNSIVGQVQFNFGGNVHPSAAGPSSVGTSPIYNVVPEHGYPAEFGIDFLGIGIFLYAEAVPTPQGNVLRVEAHIPNVLNIDGFALTFWGAPADPSHTSARFLEDAPQQSGLVPTAFLTNPVDCSTGPFTATATSDTWQSQGRSQADGSPDTSDPAWHTAGAILYPSVTGCDRLQFNPAIEVTPTTTQADEPSGLDVNLHVPQASQEIGHLITPELKNVSVALPSGVSLSPGAADGLEACSAAQIELESAIAGHCPEASALGTVKIVTPLLAGALEGQVYLGAPRCNPCSNADAADGNMFRILLEAQGSGVVIKKEGTVYANTATGQLTATFTENPQLPFSDLQVDFKGGLRAPLATPQACGTFTSSSDLTPWSTPTTPDATPLSSFAIDWDGQGGACPASLPLTPSFSAGTSNPDAGQFSPFTLTFGREDRQQDLSQIKVQLPPGLLGTLTGVPLCGEPQAALGTCSEGSRIGSMTVAAGPGGHPFDERGSVYLSGPYGGAPFGLSIVVPTVAGPFNLGNVVVRARINIDPTSAALTITTDPLPQILDGIPLRLRAANVTVDRPGFIFNPTDCSQRQIAATISGAQGALAQVQAPFAVAGCAGLPFAPRFSVSTSGRTSRANGASLDAKVVYPKGVVANIATVKVDLPKQLPARLTTLQKACLAATFDANPASCPAASVVGAARAVSPLLPVPLSGPAYFVSHGGEAFPDLVIILQGYGVRVDLTAATFISSKGITSSTFKSIPDVPVSSFELYLPEGRNSALAANGNLCTSSLAMPTAFGGHNGAEIHESTKLSVTGCPKAKKKKTKKQKSGRASQAAAHANAGQGGRDR